MLKFIANTRGALLAIVLKEITDALRDGKSMATAFLMPIFFAVVLFASISLSVSMQKDSSAIELPVAGAEKLVPLMSRFEEAGIKIVAAPENPEQAIREKIVDMVLVVPDDFEEQFRLQKHAELNLISDHSRNEAYAKVNEIRSIISIWNSEIGALRLIARNVAPGIARPISLQETNVTSDQRLASRILSGLPMFVFLIAIITGIGMTADMASGERERRSLEPLLINPVSHTSVFFGKWIAAVCLSTTLAAVGIAFQFISVHFAPLAELGLRISLGAEKYFFILLILIPVIFFAISLQLSISLFARSFKDAQSYNSLVTMLPMVPGFYLMFFAGGAQTWQMFVPILGPMALVFDIVSGETASLLHILLASFTSVIAAILFAALGIFLLKREKTIFA